MHVGEEVEVEGEKPARAKSRKAIQPDPASSVSSLHSQGGLCVNNGAFSRSQKKQRHRGRVSVAVLVSIPSSFWSFSRPRGHARPNLLLGKDPNRPIHGKNRRTTRREVVAMLSPPSAASVLPVVVLLSFSVAEEAEEAQAVQEPKHMLRFWPQKKL